MTYAEKELKIAEAMERMQSWLDMAKEDGPWGIFFNDAMAGIENNKKIIESILATKTTED